MCFATFSIIFNQLKKPGLQVKKRHLEKYYQHLSGLQYQTDHPATLPYVDGAGQIE